METTKPLMATGKEEEQDFIASCCPECTSNYEKELASKFCKDDKTFSNEEVVPHWLNLTGTNVVAQKVNQLKVVSNSLISCDII